MKTYLFPKALAPACFFLLLAAALPAHAQSRTCSVSTNDGSNYYKAVFPHLGRVVNFDPTSIAIGAVFFSLSGRINITNMTGDFPTIGGCWVEDYIVGMGTPVNNSYPTVIPNIGIRINFFPTGVGRSGTVPGSMGSIDQAYQNTFFFSTMRYTIELVKTGEITAGGVLSGTIAQYRSEGAAGQLLAEIALAPLVVQPAVPTCTVRDRSLRVGMPRQALQQFQGVGSSTGAQPFDISLTCSGGVAGTATNAHVTLTDVTRPDNTSSVLSLTQDSTASGIGVEILRQDGSLIGFGPDSAVVGNTNQWHAGQAVAGQAELRIPLSARYVQTGAAPSPGSANANATFTMSYQ